MSDFKFNAFQIKRQAHAVSRSDAGFNPFGQIWGNKNRRQTWDGEAQRAGDYEGRPGSNSSAIETGSQIGGRTKPETEPVDSPDLGPADEPKPKKRTRFFNKVQPEEPFTVKNQIQRVLCGTWLHLLLICVPTGIVLGAVVGPSLETFFVNYAAVVPLYWMGDFAMTEIGLRTGALVSNYIGISASNLVQLVSCIVLLVQGRTSILKTTLIGGILANILLLLGLAMFFGTTRRQEQYFNRTSSHTSSVLLSLASTSILIPTASLLMGQTTDTRINKQSRGASVILTFVYCLYLYFCLHTHRAMFIEEVPKVPVKPSASELGPAAIKRGLIGPTALVGMPGHTSTPEEGRTSPLPSLQRMLNAEPIVQEEDADDSLAACVQLDFWVALFTFLATTVLLYFCVDYTINSIDALTSGSELSLTFVGLILLPILNCDFTPIISAMHDDMNATMDYTVGRSIQTALLVTPFTVLLAWWLDIEDVTLVFDGFEVVSLFATVLLLNLIISEGKNNWVMGVLLLADWALVAIAAFFVD
ncbi:hypothetical protein Daus18300_004134 [Diaporthe australafricana]|uniref:Sodium/calcium exchanger membrane region domain-containing protein n=1 Tax=Diaporthe australafricana TaxID=127596 RepID=A0ABR3XAN6_9PEZI